MTDAEGTRFLAEKLMGYTWVPRTASTSDVAALKDARRIICSNPYGDDRMVVWEYSQDSEMYESEIFEPAASISDDFMLVDKMQERGYLWAMRLLGCGDISVQFWRSGTDPHTAEDSGEATDPDKCRAIFLACIEALKGKKP